MNVLGPTDLMQSCRDHIQNTRECVKTMSRRTQDSDSEADDIRPIRTIYTTMSDNEQVHSDTPTEGPLVNGVEDQTTVRHENNLHDYLRQEGVKALTYSMSALYI